MSTQYALKVIRVKNLDWKPGPLNKAVPELYVKVCLGDDKYHTTKIKSLEPVWPIAETIVITAPSASIDLELILDLKRDGFNYMAFHNEVIGRVVKPVGWLLDNSGADESNGVTLDLHRPGKRANDPLAAAKSADLIVRLKRVDENEGVRLEIQTAQVHVQAGLMDSRVSGALGRIDEVTGNITEVYDQAADVAQDPTVQSVVDLVGQTAFVKSVEAFVDNTAPFIKLMHLIGVAHPFINVAVTAVTSLHTVCNDE